MHLAEAASPQAQAGPLPLNPSQETTSTGSSTALLYPSKVPSDTPRPFSSMAEQAFGSRHPTRGKSHKERTDSSSVDLAVVKRRAATSAPSSVIWDGDGVAVG